MKAKLRSVCGLACHNTKCNKEIKWKKATIVNIKKTTRLGKLLKGSRQYESNTKENCIVQSKKGLNITRSLRSNNILTSENSPVEQDSLYLIM